MQLLKIRYLCGIMCFVSLCSLLCLNRFQDLSAKDDSIPAVFHCAVSTLQSKHQGAVTDITWLPPTFMVRLTHGGLITLDVTLETSISPI